RSPSPPRPDRDRRRAARARGGGRRPLRAAAQAGRESLRDPGREAEAGAARSARSCSVRRSSATSAAASTPPCTPPRTGSCRCGRRSSRKRCRWSMLYSKRARRHEELLQNGAFSMTAFTLPRVLRLALLAAVLGVLGFAAAGCGGGSGGGSTGSGGGSVPAGDIAVVGSQEITRAEFDLTLGRAEAGYKARKQPFPKAGTPEYQTQQNQIVSYLVQRSELDQKAAELGIKITPKQIDARVQQIIKQQFAGNVALFKKQLKASGLTEATLRTEIARPMLVSEALVKKITSGIKVTDADAHAYYIQHLNVYATPPTRSVRHILVKSKKLADKIYAQLKAGADFAKLARKYSQDPG